LNIPQPKLKTSQALSKLIQLYAFLPGAELYNALATSGVTVDLQQTPWLNGCGIPKSRRADPRAEAGRL